MISTSQWNDLVKNAKVQWREGYQSFPKAAMSLYDVMPVSVKTSEHSSITGYGFAKRKDEGGRYAQGNPQQGYTLNLSQLRIGLSDAITWEMRKFDKYREIEKKMRKLGESTAKRMELDATHQFTFGMSASSYTNRDGETVSTATGDGQNLFDTDHTITGGDDTFSNLITSAFDEDALEEAETLFTLMKDDNGEQITDQPDTIVTTNKPALKNAVKRLLGSQDSPEDANTAMNVYKNEYKHIVLPLLDTDENGKKDTDISNYWMLANVKHTEAILEVSEYPTFKAAKPDSNSEDFDTDDWKVKSSACYDLGVLDPKWIVGSTGAN